MAFPQMQTGSYTVAAGNTGQVTLNVTAGSTLILASCDNNGVVNSISSVFDTLALTWTQATSSSEGSFVDGEIWYAYCKTGGSCNVSVIYATTMSLAGIIAEYAGKFVPTGLDQTQKANAITGTALSSGATATTLQSNEIVIGVGCTNGAANLTVGAGYQNFLQAKEATNGSTVALEDKIQYVKAAQTTTMTLGSSGHWVMLAATFKQVGTLLPNRGLRPHPFSPGLAR